MATRRQLQPAPTDAWGPLPPHATPSRRQPRPRRWAERLLLVIGVLCLGYYTYVSAETLLYQAYENRELDAILASRAEPKDEKGSTARTATAAPSPIARTPKQGSTVGRIEIPRLGVSAIIKAGTDARTLQLAVGHIAGTAFPGEPGNVGLAGHRDTFFRRLRDIRPDDEIRVTTPERVFSYRVERTDVVQPSDVWVLDRTEYAALTLVTCEPVTDVGTAPQRVIVRAGLK